MRRAFLFLLVLLMSFSLIAGGSQEETASSEEDSRTLKGFGMSYPGQAPWETMPFFTELEKRTGIHVDWEYMEPSTSANERVNMIFASGGDMPDVFIRAGAATSRDSVIRWGNAGLVLDIAPYLDEYGPNIKAMFEKYPDAKKTNMTEDGKIYLLPVIYDYKPYLVSRTLQINQRWLDNLGLDMPETLDEFTEVLRAFRDLDANGNGDPNDEIPYSAHNWLNCLRGVLASFGVNFILNTYPVFYDEATNEMTFAATSDEFKAALEYMNMLYEEGLLDQEIFSQTNTRFHGLLPDDKFGVVLLHQTLNAGPVAPDLVGMAPLIGPAGADGRVWSWNSSYVFNNCSAFISASCKNPELAVQWLDYLYSEEGGTLTWMGIEGDTYVVNPDGTYSYTDKIANDPRGFSAAMGDYSIIWGNGNEPGCFTAKQLEPGLSLSSVVENTEKVLPFLQDVSAAVLPIMDDATQSEYTYLNKELGAYVKETWAKFINGSLPFSEWDAYCEQLEALGYRDFEAMVKDAYGM